MTCPKEVLLTHDKTTEQLPSCLPFAVDCLAINCHMRYCLQLLFQFSGSPSAARPANGFVTRLPAPIPHFSCRQISGKSSTVFPAEMNDEELGRQGKASQQSQEQLVSQAVSASITECQYGSNKGHVGIRATRIS
jgi:hypothetical protein